MNPLLQSLRNLATQIGFLKAAIVVVVTSTLTLIIWNEMSEENKELVKEKAKEKIEQRIEEKRDEIKNR